MTRQIFLLPTLIFVCFTGLISAEGDEEKKDKPHEGLKKPSKAKERAPDVFDVKFETTRGDVVVRIHREWAPLGADRLFNLVEIGFFKDTALFRVVDGFVVQFGIHADPEISEKWSKATIDDDPVVGKSNTRGRISFATGGPRTRTTQLFVNLGDNKRLDAMGFTPLGEVIKGMKHVDAFYKDYGDGPPYGKGPDQGTISVDGNEYLKKEFPKLDYMRRAKVVKKSD